MASDALNKISNEQLMAMAFMSNGQLTSNSTSSTSDEMNYAFQIMLQNYLEKMKDSSNNSIENNNTASGSVTANNNSGSNTTMSDTLNTSNMIKYAQQIYSVGKNLLDIPLQVENISSSSNRTNYNSGASNSSNTVSGSSSLNYSSINTSGSDMERIYRAVSDASRKYGVDEKLILAIIKQESNFDPKVVSSAGASGLMQLMPSNLSYLGVKDAFNIEDNINGGTKLFKQCLDQFNGDTQMALMAYNAGAGTMQKRGVTSASDLYKMPAETRAYVPKVLGYYKNGF